MAKSKEDEKFSAMLEALKKPTETTMKAIIDKIRTQGKSYGKSDARKELAAVLKPIMMKQNSGETAEFAAQMLALWLVEEIEKKMVQSKVLDMLKTAISGGQCDCPECKAAREGSTGEEWKGNE